MPETAAPAETPGDDEDKVGGDDDDLKNRRPKNTTSSPDLFADKANNEHEAEPAPLEDHCFSSFVLTEMHPARVCWSIMIFCTLIYIATIFLYRFTFIENEIKESGAPDLERPPSPGWDALDRVVDVIFWVDLIANFFFSFKNERSVEVDSMKLIARRYLCGLFWVNLVACIPEYLGEAIVFIFTMGSGSSDPGSLKIARIARLQRISRLTRLMRLTRLLKLMSIFSGMELMKWFESLRGVRIINFIVMLAFSVHLLACGWYICAGLEDSADVTWVDRRGIVGKSAAEQWLHAMYFVLTVFTTVGFGDMYPITELEILFVGFVMVVGTIIHSIIISEVIQAVTSTDQLQQFTEKQLNLIEAFCEHTQLPWETQSTMKDEMKYRARDLASSYNFNKDEMRKLITGKELPRWLIGSLPERMWRGKLLKNAFLNSTALYRPPRLPCLLAINLHQSEFSMNEIVYQMNDFPFNLFLVLNGTFAHVGMPSDSGGQDSPCEQGTGGLTEQGISGKLKKKKESKKNLNQTGGSGGGGSGPTLGSSAELDAGEEVDNGLYPYKLSGCQTYFGELEMMTGRPRLSTVRCESPTAMGLILHKADFNELKDQFPQFGALWQYAARRREWLRIKMLQKHTRGMSYRAMAILRIQRSARTFLEVKRRRAESGLPLRSNSHLMEDKFLNVAAAKVMDKKQVMEVNQSELKVMLSRVDELFADVNGLREDMHKVLMKLGVQPTTKLSVAV